jgi:hypothetical protein
MRLIGKNIHPQLPVPKAARSSPSVPMLLYTVHPFISQTEETLNPEIDRGKRPALVISN